MKHQLLITLAAACVTLCCTAQKKVLDHTVYDDWKSIGTLAVNADGSIVSYQISPQEGDGSLVFQRLKDNRLITIDRGYRPAFSPDGHTAVCLIKPFYRDTRQAKIKKKKADDMPKDSLAVVSLVDGKVTKFADVLSYRIGEEAATGIAFLTACPPDTTDQKKKKKKDEKRLLVYHFDGSIDSIAQVDRYAFDQQGCHLVYTTRPAKQRYAVGLYDMQERQTTTLSEERPYYSLPVWDEDGKHLLYLASDDTLKDGNKRCELLLYTLDSRQSTTLIPADYHTNLPEGWGITENATPRFSRNGKNIFVGVAPVRPPKDTTLVDFETAALDLWHYADPILQPAQLANRKQALKQTYTAVYRPDHRDLMPLTTADFDRITLPVEGDAGYALSVDRTPYMVQTQWDGQSPCNVSLVSLTDGSHTPVLTAARCTRVSASPSGRYLIWYDRPSKQWYLYDVEQKNTRCLTETCPVAFWDEEDDHPAYPPAYGMAGWIQNDKGVLLYDAYDIWLFGTDGSTQPQNLTKGKGRAEHRSYRYLRIDRDNDRKGIASDATLLLSVFDHTTKENGYATLDLKKHNFRPAVLDGYTYAKTQKAEDADVYVYQKANFNTSPDVYVTTNRWKSEKRLSDINPQMKEYNWGTAELFKWNAYDGTPLEGILYKPEDFDPNKKYPVILYFYERRSDGLYAYHAPAPSRSTVNLSFYCSRGYIVFVPDIVYKAGIPGECAYNCIVSGAEALASNPWVDKEHMGIQGQSWGGYQVAYLVTRTNLFRAAGAGAPVANMTSAYGGIRWESGMSRQFQYEQTQSRIGHTLWEAPELYIANSPLFHADRVETPLLIMHNDADGAVPWYQGIEYFTALRRLGKKVWMLQYNNEAHNLRERRNQKDLTIRLQQFFDHYLKGAPAPAWMKTGIPATRKGSYFGLETE